MTVVSVNTGRPQKLKSGNRAILTAIVKLPVEGPVSVGRLNLQGDQQADLRVHGGVDKAVYLYPSEHYEFWQEQLGEEHLPWGIFGENITTRGVLESDLGIGDRLRIGSAVLQVTQPRMPCFKLAARFERGDMIKRFWISGRSGFYCSVHTEGALQTGDKIERIFTASAGVSVAEVVSLYQDVSAPRERLLAAIQSSLAGSWKKTLRERLAGAG